MSNADIAQAVRNRIEDYIGLWTPGVGLNDRERGALLGALNRALFPGKGKHAWQIANWRRKAVLGFLFPSHGKPTLSSKELTLAEWYALWRWINFYRDDEQRWQTNPDFASEAVQVFAACSAPRDAGARAKVEMITDV
jgi:hypothetical protein